MTWLARRLQVRPGEGRLVALLAALFATLEASRGIGEVAASALVLGEIGASVLPYLYVGLGVVGLTAMVAFGAALGRIGRARLLVAVTGAFAAILVAFRIAVEAGLPGVLPLTWLAVFAAAAIFLTIMWTVAGSVLDARQAKRLFPVCTSAAIAGGFSGTLLAGPISQVAGVPNLLLVEAALVAVGSVLIARTFASFVRPLPAAARRSLVAELGAGFETVRRSPLLRRVAIVYVLLGILLFAMTFPVDRLFAATFAPGPELATALGLVAAAVTAVSFFASLVVANRFYARFGVAAAALALPVVYLAGFGLWLVQFGLATAVVVRLSQQVTQRGLSNAAWNAFYTVVPSERRAQVIAFNDGVPGQIGGILSGLLLILLLDADPQWIFLLGLATAAIATVATVSIRRGYARSIIATLRAGLAEQVLDGGPGLASLAGNPRVADELRVALADPSPGVRRLATELLGRLPGRASETAAAALEPVVGDPEPEVRAAALAALAGVLPPGDVPPSIARSLADPDPSVRVAALGAASRLEPAWVAARAGGLATDSSPAVRAELAVALVVAGEEDRPHAILVDLLDAAERNDRVAGLEAVGRLGGHVPSPRLFESLADPSPVVRAAGIRAVAALDRPDDPGRRLASIVAALDDDDRTVRDQAARSLNGWGPKAIGPLTTVLAGGTPRAQAAALVALDGHGEAARDALLPWALDQVDRATELRRRRAALASTHDSDGAAHGDEVEFLWFILQRREARAETLLLRALSVLGAPEASGLIGRCLHADDAERRAQAIEALDMIGERRLGRAVVQLLELEPDVRSSDVRAALRPLVDDPDPWVRALATRALATDLDRERGELAARAAADPDPTVRRLADRLQSHGGAPMPATDRTLGEMERMLFLRRVPLFSGLDPEDLQRFAAMSVEHLWPADEVIVREGDLGDELVVIVEGTVRVMREGTATSEARVIRTFGVGDHFGELAVLRDSPRSASVVAEEPGVRGLVIGGEAVRAILRERPEAAMAMLATLAERVVVT